MGTEGRERAVQTVSRGGATAIIIGTVRVGMWRRISGIEGWLGVNCRTDSETTSPGARSIGPPQALAALSAVRPQEETPKRRKLLPQSNCQSFAAAALLQKMEPALQHPAVVHPSCHKRD